MKTAWRDKMFSAIRLEKMENCKIGDSQNITYDSFQSSEPVLLKSVGTTNILEYVGNFYALPQSLGPIDFHNIDAVKMPSVIFADSLSEIESAVTKSCNIVQSPQLQPRTVTPPLGFMRIPGTDVNTLVNWLDTLYEKREICPADEISEFEMLESDQLSVYCFYRGHFGINLLDKLDKETKYYNIFM